MKQYIPAAKTNRAKKMATAIFAASLVLFAVSGIKVIPYRSILQLFSFALMTAAIMVCVRYLFRSYCYRVEESDDGYDFLVLELSKSGAQTVCRLSMDALLAVEPLTRELAAEKKAQKHLKIYNYCVDIAPKDVLLLTCADSAYMPGDDPICLKIQSDADFQAFLSSFVPKQ